MVQESDKAIDVYAYGVTMYEVLVQDESWKNETKESIRQKVLSGIRPIIPENRLEEYASYPSLINVIMVSWERIPEQRPTFAAILKQLSGDFMSVASLSKIETEN